MALRDTLRDTGSWVSSRAQSARAPAVAIGRWWPALLVLALAWVAWLNAPSSACTLEESAWRNADAHLTRLMIRAHRPLATLQPGHGQARTNSGATVPAGSLVVAEQTFALHANATASANASELLRAKQELESSLGELRMCRQGGAGRAERGRGAGTF
jgi:hypothetical protein